MNKTLANEIDKFLEKRVESDGRGWAPVSKEDFRTLADIIGKLIEAKWGRDADGDLPVEFDLVNRTTHNRLHYRPMPYYWVSGNQDTLQEAIRMANVNLGLATSEVQHVLNQAELSLQKPAKKSASQ